MLHNVCFKRFILSFCHLFMYMSLYEYVHMRAISFRGQKRALEHLDLRLQVVSCLIWVSIIECQVFFFQEHQVLLTAELSFSVSTYAFLKQKHVTGLCVAGWDQLHSLRKFWVFSTSKPWKDYFRKTLIEPILLIMCLVVVPVGGWL